MKKQRFCSPFIRFAEAGGADGGGSEPTPKPTPTPTPQGGDEVLGEGGIKALRAERSAREAAEKDAKELRAQLDAIEAEKLTELEKAQKEAKTASEVAAKAAAEALRYKYAAKHGISDEDAELFLTGTDEETVAAQAERLAAHQKDQKLDQQSLNLFDPTQGAGAGQVQAFKSGRDHMAAAFDAQN